MPRRLLVLLALLTHPASSQRNFVGSGNQLETWDDQRLRIRAATQSALERLAFLDLPTEILELRRETIRSRAAHSGLPFVILRIPKTGSNSLEKKVYSSVRRENLTITDWWQTPLFGVTGIIRPQPSNDVLPVYKPFKDRDGAIAHVGFGFLNFATGSPMYITVLRDPLDRVRSLFRQLVGNFDHPAHDLVHGLDFAQAVNRSLHANPVAREGAILDFWHGRPLRPGAALVSNEMTWYLCGVDCVPGETPLELAVQRALSNLARVHLVGVTTDLGTLYTGMTTHLPWLSDDGATPHTHQSNKAIDTFLPAQLERQLRRMLNHDYKLFHAANLLRVT